MKFYKTYPIAALLFFYFNACTKKDNVSDASGTFEAVETIVSAEANGEILDFTVEEGQDLKAGQYVGYIDTIQLFLKMKQMEAQLKSAVSQKPDIQLQIGSVQEQISAAERERNRTANLVKANAATQKQLDDANTQLDVLKKQLLAMQSSLRITTKGINLRADPIELQVQQLQDQLQKSKIMNPVSGTVLTKYAEVHEMAASGKPLYKIADLSTIILRAYITGDQLGGVKLRQQVKVLVDSGKGDYKTYAGVVEWINSKAEFTPKTIQTKDERANLVYAIKVLVKNDGYLKIGMYGELNF